MPKNAGGISFQDAVQEALAETATEIASSDDGVSAPLLSNSDEPVTDQPTVETEGQVGVFGPSVVEGEEEDEQPIDTDSLRFPINGELMTIGEIQSLITSLEAGSMRHSDYTRKTQELSVQRQENEKAIILWEALHGPDAKNVVANLYRRVTGGEKPAPQDMSSTPSTTDIEALVAEKVAAALANDPRIADYERQQAMDLLNGVFAQIEEAYDVTLLDSDKDLVIAEANRLGTTDLEFVFDGMWQRKQRQESGRANVRKNATTSGSHVLDGDDLDEGDLVSWRAIAEAEARRSGIVDTVFNFS